MTLRGAAKILNKNHNYFSVLKTTNPKALKYIVNLPGSDLVEQYRRYEMDQEMVIDAFVSLYYWLEENKLLNDFSREVYNRGITTHRQSFINGASKVIFTMDNKFRTFKSFCRYSIILKILIEYQKKKEQEDEKYIYNRSSS